MFWAFGVPVLVLATQLAGSALSSVGSFSSSEGRSPLGVVGHGRRGEYVTLVDDRSRPSKQLDLLAAAAQAAGELPADEVVARRRRGSPLSWLTNTT